MKSLGSLSFLQSRHALAWLLRLTDLIGMIAIYYVIYGLRNLEYPIELHKSYRLYVILFILIFVLYIGDCYRVDRQQPNWALPLRTVIATAIAGLLIGISVYLLGPELLYGGYNVLARTVLIPSLFVFSIYAVMSRLIAQNAINRLAGRTRWLVIANRNDGVLDYFWRSFQRQKSIGDLVILADGEAVTEIPIAGSWNSLEIHLKENWSGLVLVGGWQMPDAMIERLMHARLKGLRIYDIGEYYERMWEKLPIQHLQRGWFIVTSGFTLLHERSTTQLKRLCDLLFSSLMLVGSFPVLVIVYTAIRIDSKGSGLFSQQRVGLNGQIFTCWKFRTMVVGSEQGNKYTESNDSRVTRVGRILRKIRLDEFPQLWNVLKGDMSFIGPRAEWTKCVADYENVIPFYQLRHLIKPGLTGWAQVNYPYGVSVDDAREKLEYDLYYLKNHSFALDLVILVRTIRVVLFGTGAR